MANLLPCCLCLAVQPAMAVAARPVQSQTQKGSMFNMHIVALAEAREEGLVSRCIGEGRVLTYLRARHRCSLCLACSQPPLQESPAAHTDIFVNESVQADSSAGVADFVCSVSLIREVTLQPYLLPLMQTSPRTLH
jgi:hypothetical protein